MGRNTALICEFNPLHNGHKAILAHAKTMGDRVVAIMSGNFTQRSECAIFDKYKRDAELFNFVIEEFSNIQQDFLYSATKLS